MPTPRHRARPRSSRRRAQRGNGCGVGCPRDRAGGRPPGSRSAIRAASKRCSNDRRQARRLSSGRARPRAPPRRRRRRRSRSRRRSIDLGHRARRNAITGVPHAMRLDHHQPERLRPVDREEQRACARRGTHPSSAPPTSPTNSTHGRDRAQRAARSTCSIVGAILGMDLGRDFESAPGSARDLDGAVEPLLGRDPAQEGQVVARLVAKRVQVCGAGRGGPSPPVARQAADGAGRRRSRPAAPPGTPRTARRDPSTLTRPWSVVTLGTGVRRSIGKVQVVRVEVDHVEPGGVPEDQLHQTNVVRQGVAAARVAPERAGAAREPDGPRSSSRRWRTASPRGPAARAPR